MAHKEYGVTDITDILHIARAGYAFDARPRQSAWIARPSSIISALPLHMALYGFTADTADDQLQKISLAVFRAVHSNGRNNSASGAAAPLIPHRDLISGWLE